MQITRQHILEILREVGQATVDDIVEELRKKRGNITAVTVRHHLAVLQENDLVTEPQLRHRSTPGRPQYIYALTNKAAEHFPNNYQQLAAGLISQLQSQHANVIIEGLAQNMALDAEIADGPIEEKLDAVVAYLNEHSYQASWRETDAGYILCTQNCPYHHIAQTTDMLCTLDMRLIAGMLGVVPRLVSRVAEGDAECAYLIPAK